jgi:hypothetical protein
VPSDLDMISLILMPLLLLGVYCGTCSVCGSMGASAGA